MTFATQLRISALLVFSMLFSGRCNVSHEAKAEQERRYFFDVVESSAFVDVREKIAEAKAKAVLQANKTAKDIKYIKAQQRKKQTIVNPHFGEYEDYSQ